ncbi:MAG TPA: alpha/beta hydrolase, partial [Blastocatellia bacterium]|nr:alpha/beta hydrolase [Blastocatellia bacterium]
MSKKQSLLTLLALITLIVNFEVRANSLIVAQPGSRLPLKPCKLPAVKEAVLCGNYEVWENRESLKGRRISLYVVVLPALNPNPAPDPLFAISGGPGQAATEVFLNSFADIRKNRDIVLVDQRGAGRSNSLSCDAANLQEFVQIIVGEDAPRESIRRCRAQLEQKADLRMYATPAAVEDLDEVRKWLGYKTINLYGGSYGSRVALVYLRRFPQNVRTVTLRAVYPTTIPVPLYAPRYNQRSLDRLLDDCARDEKCRQSFPDLKQEFQTALDLLTSSPANITVTDPRSNKPVELAITRGVFAGAIRQLLLDSNSQRFIPVIVRGASKGDYAPLKTLVGQALRTIGGINFGMNTSVICSEEIPRIKPADIKREAAGAFLTGSVVQTRIDLCREWPRGRAPANYFEPVKSNIPVLLISGELDPATPFEWADETAKHLPNSLHIIQPGVAHGPFTSCAQNVMNRFVDAGTTTGLDATCV